MQDDDLQIMQRISAREKARYDELDLKLTNTMAGTICYVMINFSELLSNLDAFRSGLVDDKDFTIHAAIECLNVYSHYKHYFQTRDAYHVILVGYVRDSYIYNENKEILDMLYEFTKYFPNIYLIPNIANKGVLHVHIAAAVIEYMKKMTPNKKNYSSIYVISNISSDRQLLFTFPTKNAVAIYKGYGFTGTVFLNKYDYIAKIMKSKENYVNFPNKAELEYMNVLVGKYLNSVKFKHSKMDTLKVNYKTTRTADKILLLERFISDAYDPSKQMNISKQFILFLQSQGEIINTGGVNNLTFYETYFDYRYQNIGKLNEIIIPLFNSWKQKIKDYSIARASEGFKILQQHEMYLNWLI